MKPKSSLRSFLALSGSALLAISYSHAGQTWDGGSSTDNKWNRASNWDGATVNLDGTGILASFTGALTFTGNTQTTTDNDIVGAALTGINFTNDGTTGKTSAFYLGGNALSLSGSIITSFITAGSAITDEINLAMDFGAATRTINTQKFADGAAHDLMISGIVSGAGGGITKTGLGTLTLTAANSYTGGTFVNGGKLVLDMNSGGSLNSASTLQTGAASPAGTFEIKGKSGAFVSSQTMGNLTLGNNSYLKIVLNPNNGTGTTLTLGDAWSIGGPSAVLIDYSSSNTGTREVVTANATTTTTLADGIYKIVLVKDSNGVTGFGTRAAGSNQAITRYDDRSIADGGLSTLLTSAIPTSSTVNYTTRGAGASVAMTNVTRTINSLVVDTTNNAFALDTGANNLTIDTAILFRGSNNATISGGTIVWTPSAYIHQVGTGVLTINNVIQVGSSSLFAKTGSGTLVLGGNNTFTGAMNIHEGIVKLGAAGNGTQSPLGTTLGNTLINVGGALDLNGITLSTAENLTLYGTGVANGGALTNSGANASYSGLLTISANASIIASGGDINLTNVGSTSIVAGLTVGGAKNTSLAAILSGAASATAPASLTKIDAGTLTLTGVNTYRGGTLVTGGTLVFGNTASKSTFGTHVFDAGTTLGLGVGAVSGDFGSADITAAFGTGTILTNVTVTATTNVGIDTTAGNFTHSADITGSPTKGLTKLGANTLTLSGNNTYTGATTINAGTLALGATGSITSSSGVNLTASTAKFNVTTANFTLGAAQALSGIGTVENTGRTFTANGILAPGNSPGTLTVDGGTFALGAGGDYNFQILDATGAAGTAYDTVNLVNGATLDLSSLTAASYTINLSSLLSTGPDVAGNAANFNNTLSYSWTLFATGSSLLSSFDANDFTINAAGFSNALGGGGSFSVGLADSDTDLVLSYAIPEPAAALLGSLGLLTLLRRRRHG